MSEMIDADAIRAQKAEGIRIVREAADLLRAQKSGRLRIFEGVPAVKKETSDV